ncbi:MAG: hypothetical protein ACD_16C00036G0006 [uncultured bacterium]|nr:MAG: hypothetical protein ACD_16C00036G0006 [uncultured bacterium]OFW91252.1 MAG: hypothetical protein A2W46_02510 [Alphaproteobacteria bacterium RIFCSPHIGHO2_12_42_13]HBG34396.1 hypothetical protein [Holosporales bacterium]
MSVIAAEKIAHNIKKKISEVGLSVHALEKKAGLKQSAVQNILYGKSKKPSLHLIQSIAQVLHCTTSELLEEGIGGLSRKENEEKPTILQTETWNVDLYIDTLRIINSLSKKNKNSLSKDEFFSCAEEIYLYSLKTDKLKPDKHFAEWLIDKTCRRSNHAI